MANPLNTRSFINYLGRNRLYTLINILGLSVSLMFVILIGIYAYGEFSVDRWNPNRKRIVALGDNEFVGSAYGISHYLLSQYPEIEKICCVYPETDYYPVTIRGEKYEVDVLYADSTFFDLFPFGIIEGDAGILKTVSQAFVSESFAARVFGDESPLGQTITITDEHTVVVGGIMEDIAGSVIPYSDIVTCAEGMRFINPNMASDQLNNVGPVIPFILVRKGADLRTKTADMEEYFKTFFWIYQNGWSEGVTLTPLRDVYFADTDGFFHTGDKNTILLLLTTGLVILIFAVLNYINLTVAQAGFRAKEMATRKLLGASRGEVFLKFIFESIILCGIAFIAGILLAGAFQNAFANLLQVRIDVWDSLASWQVSGVCLLFIILLGTVAGLVPALHILRYNPLDVVKGTFRLKTKMIFGKVFIVFQNVATIVLITCSLTIMLQIGHMLSQPLGHNINDILAIDVWAKHGDRVRALREELARLPMIKDVSLSNGYPVEGGNNNTEENYADTGKRVSFQYFTADSAFFRILGLRVKQDNHVAAQGGVWVNERLLYEIGKGPDAEEFILPNGNGTVPIRGIIEDIKIWNALDARNPPVFIDIRDFSDIGFIWHVLVQVEGDHAEAYAAVDKVYEEVMDERMSAKYMEDELVEAYAVQYRTSHIVTLFTVIAVIISMLGLVAMSTYFIRQRAGEIAIRRVFGSTGQEIFRRLTFNFLRLVVLAWAIAVPVAWYLMSRWLAEFPYRIGLSPWIFIAAGLLALIVSAVAVSWQSSAAARRNPVEVIKKE